MSETQTEYGQEAGGYSEVLKKVRVEHRGAAREQISSFENNSNPADKLIFEWNDSIETVTPPMPDKDGKFTDKFGKLTSEMQRTLDTYLNDLTLTEGTDQTEHRYIPHLVQNGDNNQLTMNDVDVNLSVDRKLSHATYEITLREHPWDGKSPMNERGSVTRDMTVFMGREKINDATGIILTTEEGGKKQQTYYLKEKDKPWQVLEGEDKKRVTSLFSIEGEEPTKYKDFDEFLEAEDRIRELNDDKKDALLALVDDQEGDSTLNYEGLKYMARKDLGIDIQEDKEEYKGTYTVYANPELIKSAKDIVIVGKDSADPSTWYLESQQDDGGIKMVRLFVKEGEIKSEGSDFEPELERDQWMNDMLESGQIELDEGV